MPGAVGAEGDGGGYRSGGLGKAGPLKPSEQNRSRPEKVLRDLVCQAVKSKILDSHLRPTQRISEISVANELGVSRTLAHEALRRLEQEEWLILVPRQGYYVGAYSVREAMRSTAFELRSRGIPRGRRLNALRTLRCPGLRHKWEALEHRSETLVPLDWLEADEAFHTLMAEASGNRTLVSMVQRINERIRIIRRIDFTRSERATSLEPTIWRSWISSRRAGPAAAAAPVEQPIQSSNESVKDLAQICVVEE
jgi:DNA-binding GntR family transcriptional regulator